MAMFIWGNVAAEKRKLSNRSIVEMKHRKKNEPLVVVIAV